jgi:hypothetical protein
MMQLKMILHEYYLLLITLRQLLVLFYYSVEEFETQFNANLERSTIVPITPLVTIIIIMIHLAITRNQEIKALEKDRSSDQASFKRSF